MSTLKADDLEPVAGNGLLPRRLFLTGGVAALSLLRALPLSAQQNVPAWMTAPGGPLRPYGERSPHESSVQRIVGPMPGTTGSGSSRAPLEFLEGMITPNSLHFERNHSGVPDIPPAQHRLVIHGLVRRPVDVRSRALTRYPLISRIHFIECSGNSAPLVCRTAAAGRRRRPARPCVVRRMDRRAARHAPGRSGRASRRQMAARRRRRRGRDESQCTDREGARRRDDCDLPERRAVAARERVSDAARCSRDGRATRT